MDYKSDLQSDDDFDCSNGYSDSFGNNNNSNSGYNTNGESRMPNPNGLSKAELRKTNKPIMEKRRRARINHCLNELKSLILEAMKKDPARHTKLEKADILEMTVKHLQSVQRQQLNMAIQTDPSVVHKFKTGFVECAEEVQRYVGQLEGVDVGVRQRLSNHLKNCATSLEQLGSMTNFNNGYRGQLGAAGVAGLFGGALPNPLVPSTVTAPNVIFPPPLPQDLNNNNNNNNSSAGAPIQMGGVQLIPSRLPSGEFALIMPNASGASAANLLNNNAFASAAFAAWPHATPSSTAAVASAAQLPGSTATPQLNDFTTHAFQHLSAFSLPQQPKVTTLAAHNNNNNNNHTIKSANYSTTTTTVVSAFNQAPPTNNLHHNSTATTSPPLSPISSACSSSHGDDSIMHTSSDFANSRPATPPLDVANSQHNFSGVFSTPSSAESSMLSLSSRSSTHLQQQQVSSTSGSDLNSTGSSTSTTAANTTTNTRSSLKRSLTETADSSDSSDEPSSKKFADNQQSEKWENEDKEKEKEKETSLQKQSEGNSQQQKTKGPLIIDERDSMWRPW